MNRKEEQSRNAYNKLAESYNDTFDGRYTRAFKAEIAFYADLKENDAVLDVGCGTGELLSLLNHKCPIRGFGADISEEMVKTAQKHYGMFRFCVSGCAPLPYEDGTFDVVTVSAAFHHFPEPKKFAREAYRVLKRGGRLYIAEPYYPALLRLLMNTAVLPLYRSGDVKLYSPKELVAFFSGAGFLKTLVGKKGTLQMLSAQKNLNENQSL